MVEIRCVVGVNDETQSGLQSSLPLEAQFSVAGATQILDEAYHAISLRESRIGDVAGKLLHRVHQPWLGADLGPQSHSNPFAHVEFSHDSNVFRRSRGITFTPVSFRLRSSCGCGFVGIVASL